MDVLSDTTSEQTTNTDDSCYPPDDALLNDYEFSLRYRLNDPEYFDPDLMRFVMYEIRDTTDEQENEYRFVMN